MTSPPLDSTRGRTKLGMTCHHRPCTARTVGRRQAWHAISALEKHTWSNDVGRGMTSPPLDRTHGRQRRARHDITALGKHTQSDDVGRGMTSPPLDNTHGRQRRAWHDITAFGQHTRSNVIRHGIPLSPLGSTQGRKTLGMAYHHRLWAAQMTERRQGWHDFTALGRNTRSNDVGRGMTSPPLDCTHSRTTSGVE